jgi:heme/copper-type cytochrome/quinol oxidase subunit 2
MNDAGTAELIFVLAVMGVLFVFGVAACVIFFVVYRREKRDRLRAQNQTPPAPPAERGEAAPEP